MWTAFFNLLRDVSLGFEQIPGWNECTNGDH